MFPVTVVGCVCMKNTKTEIFFDILLLLHCWCFSTLSLSACRCMWTFLVGWICLSRCRWWSGPYLFMPVPPAPPASAATAALWPGWASQKDLRVCTVNTGTCMFSFFPYVCVCVCSTQHSLTPSCLLLLQRRRATAIWQYQSLTGGIVCKAVIVLTGRERTRDLC